MRHPAAIAARPLGTCEGRIERRDDVQSQRAHGRPMEFFYMSMKQLLEKRARLTDDMRAIHEAPAGDGGDLSNDQATKFDALKEERAKVDAAIERQTLIDEADRRAAGAPVAGSGDHQFDQELRQFSLVKAIGAQVPDLAGSVDAGREREIGQELARRSGRPFQGIAIPMQVFEQRVTTSTSTPGAGAAGKLIAVDHLGGQYIDLLRSKMVAQRLGARVLNGLHGNVSIPKAKSGASGEWIAENGSLTAADSEWTSVTMSPKHAGALTELSRNVLQQTSPDIEQLVRVDFAAVLARAVDKVAINGGGSNEPDGVLQTGGINTVTTSGTMTWAHALQFIEEAELDDTMGSGWATHPSVVRKLRSTPKQSSGDGDIWEFIMSGPNDLAGFPLVSSTQVPVTSGTPDTHNLIFGSWSELMVGYWSTLDVLVNPFESTAYKKGNVQIRALLTCDVVVRHPEAFCAATDIQV